MRQWQGQTGLNLDIDIRCCHYCRIKLQIVALTLQKANSWLAKPKLRKPGFISLSAVNSMETWSSLSQGKTVTLLDAINSCLFTPMCQHPHLRCVEGDAAKFQFPHPLERNPAKLKKRHGTKPSPVPWLSISKKCVSQKPSWTVWISNLQLGPKPRSWTWSWIWPIGLSTHLRHPEKRTGCHDDELGISVLMTESSQWREKLVFSQAAHNFQPPSKDHRKISSSVGWSLENSGTTKRFLTVLIFPAAMYLTIINDNLYNWQITETHAKHINLNQSK